MTTLTQDQKLTFKTTYVNEFGKDEKLVAVVRFDDQCGNGHNTFSVTGTIYVGGRDIAGGCLHDDIGERFPELAPFIKWHLTSTDGPMHYIANTVYHAGNYQATLRVDGGKDRNLDRARSTAVWPDATDEELTDAGLDERLADRLPALMVDFRAAVESLGLVY
jgi:hypothetical protein